MFWLRNPHSRFAVLGALFGAVFAIFLEQLAIPLGVYPTIGLVTLFSIVAAYFDLNMPARVKELDVASMSNGHTVGLSKED